MGQTFASIPTRNNGDNVDAGWFNIIQQAGANVESVVGIANNIADTAFIFANNTGSPTNITGLLFNSLSVLSAKVWISCRRITSTTNILSEIEVFLTYVASTNSWQISDVNEHGDASGLTLSVTAGGQMQYTSTNESGSSYAGNSRFRASGAGL